MAAVDEDEGAEAKASAPGFLEGYRFERVTLAVAGIVVLALALRFLALGVRTAHWDEARVAYWVLDFTRTGNFQYRPIIHGSFYQQTNRLVFWLVGPSDTTMRAVPALLGGLFPLSALLLRQRLRDVEVAVLALFFAINPIILYYTRFMRADPIVAMFAFVAFGCFVRTIDTQRPGYMLGGVAAVAIAFTAKGNTILYLLSWGGAAILLLDHRLFLTREGRAEATSASAEETWVDVLRGTVRRLLGGLWAWRWWLVLAAVEFVAIITFFYAPRGDATIGPTVGATMADPTLFPALIEQSTLGTWNQFYELWIAGDQQEHAYLPFLKHYLGVLQQGALVICLLAVLGFLSDRYVGQAPRDVVAFASYWGFVSVLGYPLATDIRAPWATIHAVVPLAIPAAVAGALLFRWTREAYQARDDIAFGAGVLALVLVLGIVTSGVVSGVYVDHSERDNELVQYAQPADDLQPVREDLGTITEENEGTDVVLYGDYLVDSAGPGHPDWQPACSNWHESLPLPWYFQHTDAEVTCADNTSAVRAHAEDDVPMVIMREDDAAAFSGAFEDYEASTHRIRLWGTETRIFVHEDYA